MKTIKLYNNGHFFFDNLVPDKKGITGRCGPEDNSLYKYEVEVKGSPDILNKKCFLIDVNEIDEYFKTTYGQNKKPVTMSCEEIVLKVIDDLLKLFKDCEDKLVSIKVRIRPTPYSHFEAEWTQ